MEIEELKARLIEEYKRSKIMLDELNHVKSQNLILH